MVSMRWLPAGISPSWRASVSETTVEAPPVSSRKRYGPAPFTLTAHENELVVEHLEADGPRGSNLVRLAMRPRAAAVGEAPVNSRPARKARSIVEDQRRAEGPCRS